MHISRILISAPHLPWSELNQKIILIFNKIPELKYFLRTLTALSTSTILLTQSSKHSLNTFLQISV